MLLCSCSFSLEGRQVLDVPSNNVQSTANAKMDKILEAIKNKDKDALKSMFYKQAINKSKNVDNSIVELIDFFQGDFVSYNDWNAVGIEDTVNDGDRQKILDSTYDVVTSKQKYHIAIRDFTIDTANKDNIGIWSFYIIKLQNDTDPQFAFRGDSKFTPGINFNKKNTIPGEHS